MIEHRNPIIDEIRSIRHEIAAKCDNDVSKIIAYVEAENERLGLMRKAA